jgi:acetyltransferase
VRAFFYMVRYIHNQEMSRQVPQRLPTALTFDTDRARQLVNRGLEENDAFLTEADAKALLASYGLPVTPTRVAATLETALALADEMGYPLAMKIASPEITHKTEVDGIRLDIRSREEVASAFETIISNAASHRPDARIDGVSLQPYVHRADYELLVGAKRDENFGPVLVFGLGGVFTEVVKDRNIGLPPMNRLLARRLMQETRAYKLLSGYRSRPPADMVRLEEMLIRLSQLVIDFPQIKEIDLNPVVVKDGRPTAVDARISLSPFPVEAPMHLAISPYPGHYEQWGKTEDGVNLFIRPIRPEDGPLFSDLFDRLSAASIYLRFCRHVKALSAETLARLTQIDYDREMALVAVENVQGRERMLGAARIINAPHEEGAEFSVMVADDWQGKGIGALLLMKLIAIGRQRGLETIWGVVLKENTSMLRLGRKLGFKRTYDPEIEMMVLTIDLKQASSG